MGDPDFISIFASFVSREARRAVDWLAEEARAALASAGYAMHGGADNHYLVTTPGQHGAMREVGRYGTCPACLEREARAWRAR